MPAPGQEALPGVRAGRRIVAGLLDMIVLSVLAAGLAQRTSIDSAASWRIEGWRLALLLTTMTAYFLVTELVVGATLGKWVLGLRVYDVAGTRPTPTQIVKRNALRPIDGLPVGYLIGFIVMMTNRDRRRIGDLVSGTYVRVDPAGSPTVASTTPPPGGRRHEGWLVAAATAGVLVIASIGFSNKSTLQESIGRLDYTDDVVPYVEELGETAFRSRSAAALIDAFPPGSVDDAEVAETFDRIVRYAGELVGEWTVERHFTSLGERVLGFGQLDLVTVEVRAEYARGFALVDLVIADLDGEPRLLRWGLRLE